MAFKSSRLLIALACLIFASHCAAQLLDTNKGVQYAVQQDDNESYWTVYGTSSSLNADSEPWAPGPSQTWILDSSGSPSGVIQVQIINSANSVCLQMPGCGSGFSSNIGACDSSHGPFQMWQIDTNNDGTYVIWSVGCGIARSLGVYPDFQRITLLELHNPNDVHIATTSIVGTTTVSIVKDVATSTMIAWVILTSVRFASYYKIALKNWPLISIYWWISARVTPDGIAHCQPILDHHFYGICSWHHISQPAAPLGARYQNDDCSLCICTHDS